jgi:hypothetical protein
MARSIITATAAAFLVVWAFSWALMLSQPLGQPLPVEQLSRSWDNG